MEGVDYAWARPNPSCLYSNGKRFAVRYVGPNTASGKWLRAAERDSLRAAGLQIALVYQTTASFMTNGYDEGVRAGQRSLAMANGLGITGVPFYHALDTDPRGLSSSQWNAVKAYLNGAASVTGRNKVGIYGGYKAIEDMVPTYATYGWQTYAWSGGALSGKAHLYQYRNGQSLCGGELDLCRSLKPYFGQWPSAIIPPEEEDLPMAIADDIYAQTTEILKALRVDPAVSGSEDALGRRVKETHAAVAALPDSVWDYKVTNAIDGTEHPAKSFLKFTHLYSKMASEATGVDVDEAAIAASVAQAVVDALPDGSLTSADVEAAVRAVFSDAGTA